MDSDFGHAFLVRKLDSKDFVERLTAAIAKVALIRDQFRSALRLSQGHTTAMDVLFDSLDALLSNGEMQTYRGMKTYEDGVSFPNLLIFIVAPYKLHLFL